MMHILVLELLNTIDFMTAALGIPLYLQPFQDSLIDAGEDGYVDEDSNVNAFLLLQKFYYLSNTAFVLCGVLTDGILVSLTVRTSDNLLTLKIHCKDLAL